jgi:hypothetical protein
MPDWLLGARRMPTDESRPFDITNTVLQPDVETGTQKPSAPEATTTHLAQDADVQIISQNYQNSEIPHFGEASFLEDVSRTRESSLRRRNAGIDAPEMFASTVLPQVCL